MIQIKFRGRDCRTGRWIYGDSIKHTDNASGNGIEELTYIGSKVPNARKVGAMKWNVVDPDTVGQFTGLLDKNGKEIYEGDILGTSERVIGYVKGGVRGYCYDVVYLNHPKGEERWTLYATVKYDYPNEIQVIGNIFDNPELIK